MRLNLDGLDATGLELDFSPDLSHERRIALGAIQGLRGLLTRNAEGLRLSDVTCESLIVSLLHLKFDGFKIALESPGVLAEVMGSYEHGPRRMDITVVAGELRAPNLSVDFSSFQIHGELRARKVELQIAGPERRIRAESLVIDGLKFSGSSALGAEKLIAEQVDISWGTGGYRVRVADLRVPKASGAIDLSGSLGSSSKEPKREPAESAKKRAPVVEWNMLDGLSGSLDVDVLVDMKVPVIGSRNAKHPLRISIQEGALNYLDLEKNLSPLEDSLLDFAVRDGALVLERGIPLLPTRGRGKPMVVWPLSADDLALTAQDRVRLAILPRGQSVTDSSEGGSSGFALQQLSFVEVQAMFRLSPTQSRSSLRGLSFDELLIQGTVHHRPNGERLSGELTGSLRSFGGSIVDGLIGTSRLDVGSVTLGELSNLWLGMRGVDPQRLKFELTELHAQSLSVGTRGH